MITFVIGAVSGAFFIGLIVKPYWGGWMAIVAIIIAAFAGGFSLQYLFLKMMISLI
jgi:hypothetical protein